MYLGATISFRKFEQETFKHRLGLARGSFSRLRGVLTNRTVPLRLRLQLWKGCVWPALLHALDVTGLPQPEIATLQSLLIQQARTIANSHSMITRESKLKFVTRLKLPDPVGRLQSALWHRVQSDVLLHALLAPDEVQLQWRSIVRGHLHDGTNSWLTPSQPSVSASNHACLQPVQKVLRERFSCEECGQEFVTQASLRRHIFAITLMQNNSRLELRKPVMPLRGRKWPTP